MNRDIAQAVVNLPIEVASRAVRAEAPALARDMLRLFTSFDLLLTGSSQPEVRALHGWAQLRLSEYGRFFLEPLVEDRDDETRERGRELMFSLFDTYGVLSHGVLEQNPSQLEALRPLEDHWDRFLRHWEPEYERPGPIDVELARSAEPAYRQTVSERVALNARRAETKQELVEWRKVWRFVLAHWSLRRFEQTELDAWAEAFSHFAAYVANDSSLPTVVNRTLDAEFDDRLPLSDWVLSDLPSFEAHFVGSTHDLIRTFVMLSLMAVSPPTFDAERTSTLAIHLRSVDVAQLVRDVADSPAAQSLVDTPEVASRAEATIEALTEFLVAAQVVEEDAVIESEIDSSLVTEFEEILRRRWAAERVIANAVEASAGAETVFEPEIEPTITLTEWVTKRVFQTTHRVYGHDHLAESLADAVVRRETTIFIELLAASPHNETTEATVGEDLRRAVTDCGNPHSVAVFIGPRWHLRRLLISEHAPPEEHRGVPPWLVGSTEDYVGSVAGAPVVQVAYLPEDWLCVVDLSRLAPLRRDEQGLRISIDTFSATEAAEMASTEDLASRHDVERRILLSTRIRVAENVGFEVGDAGAMRVLHLRSETERV